MSTELIAGLVGVAAFLLILVVLYNRLVRLRYVVRSSWSDIDVHLKKRYELVPNLVETVKGYTGHERDTLMKVTELRAAAMRASTPGEKAKAENGLAEMLRSLFALVEAYPALEADAHFQDLMKQMRDESGTTFVFSTHDPKIMNEAERIFTLEDGRLTQTAGKALAHA